MPEHYWFTWTFWTENSQAIRDIALTLAAIIGLPLVIWRTWATHQQSRAALRQSQAALEQAKSASEQAKTASQQADIASKRHEQQTEADRQRRITESFARAIEQLASEKLEVRLGAIYALERIARESPIDHWPIMETLTAYARGRAPWGLRDWSAPVGPDRRNNASGIPDWDVLTILTVIGRRRREHDPKRQVLNLRHTNLRGARLATGSFEGADLINCCLDAAHLEGADLTRASLAGASLRFAELDNASLVDAALVHADLTLASLRGSDLRGASLHRARLDGVDLTRCRNLTQQQLQTAWGDAETKLPHGLTIPLRDNAGPLGTGRDPAAAKDDA